VCWVCVIFFARVVVSERLRRARRGVRGGGAGGGGRSPRAGVRGQRPRFFFFFGPTYFRRGHISGTTYFRDDILPGRHISGTT
jgi:hypothetical protein